MIPNKYKELISSLIDKTRSNEAIWNSTSSDRQYSLLLNSGMIVITKKSDILLYIDFYDHKGQNIDQIIGSYTDPDFRYVQDLYTSIDNSIKAEKFRQIDNFLNEIKSSNRIGKKNNDLNDLL